MNATFSVVWVIQTFWLQNKDKDVKKTCFTPFNSIQKFKDWEIVEAILVYLLNEVYVGI